MKGLVGTHYKRISSYGRWIPIRKIKVKTQAERPIFIRDRLKTIHCGRIRAKRAKKFPKTVLVSRFNWISWHLAIFGSFRVLFSKCYSKILKSTDVATCRGHPKHKIVMVLKSNVIFNSGYLHFWLVGHPKAHCCFSWKVQRSNKIKANCPSHVIPEVFNDTVSSL